MSVKWWRRPWVAPMFVVMAGFLAFSLPPYLMGGSRLPLREGFAAHKILLDIHIGFGVIALITCAFQVWPWFRGEYPRAHKIMGRVYVIGGVLPAGLMGLVVAVTALTGPVGRIGNVLLSLLWLLTTLRGLKSARRRQFADHRQWMIRSFALCTSIVLNRVWLIALLIGLQPWLDGHYGGDMDELIADAAMASIWLSWTVNLALAEWWLAKGKGKPRAKRGLSVSTGREPKTSLLSQG